MFWLNSKAFDQIYAAFRSISNTFLLGGIIKRRSLASFCSLSRRIFSFSIASIYSSVNGPVFSGLGFSGYGVGMPYSSSSSDSMIVTYYFFLRPRLQKETSRILKNLLVLKASAMWIPPSGPILFHCKIKVLR